MPFKASLTLVLIMLFSRATKANNDYAYIFGFGFGFGFGSLMLTPARTATAPDPEGAVYIPVKIREVERQWILWSERSQQRSLGIEQSIIPDNYINGLIVAVKKDQLAAFDKREDPAYQRIKIPIDNVTFYLDTHQDLIMQGEQNTDAFVYSPRKESSFYFDKEHNQKKSPCPTCMLSVPIV